MRLLEILSLLWWLIAPILIVHAGGDSDDTTKRAALFCEQSRRTYRARGDNIYPCHSVAHEDYQCDVEEEYSADDFDSFEDFEHVSTLLIECDRGEYAGLCRRHSRSRYTWLHWCDEGDAAIITIVEEDDRRRNRILRSGHVGVGTKKEVAIDGGMGGEMAIVIE